MVLSFSGDTMLNAGRLRHRLSILNPTRTQDETSGEYTNTWSVFCVVWGSFEYLSVKDFIAASSVQNKASARAMIRYKRDVTVDMRVRHKGTDYDICGPILRDNDSGNEYCTLLLAEALND